MPVPCRRDKPISVGERLVTEAANIRDFAQVYVDQCNASSLNLNTFVNQFLPALVRFRTAWIALIATPGALQGVQAMFPNKTITTTDLNNVTTAAATLIGQVEQQVPADTTSNPPNKWVLSLNIAKDGAGTTTERAITAAGTLNTARTQLQTFQAAFDVT